MKIVLASHNKHKIAELQTLLRQYIPTVELLSLGDFGLNDEIVEDGATFEENALIKARYAARSGYIGIGDDSGLCVESLGGAPGIYSARFAGEDGNTAKNNEKLLLELKGKTDRRAKFVCVIACVMPDGEEFTVRGEAHGEIIETYKGEGGFGYDPLFRYGDKTFAEMTSDEKNLVSHRGRAIKKFAEELERRAK